MCFDENTTKEDKARHFYNAEKRQIEGGIRSQIHAWYCNGNVTCSKCGGLLYYSDDDILGHCSECEATYRFPALCEREYNKVTTPEEVEELIKNMHFCTGSKYYSFVSLVNAFVNKHLKQEIEDNAVVFYQKHKDKDVRTLVRELNIKYKLGVQGSHKVDLAVSRIVAEKELLNKVLVGYKLDEVLFKALDNHVIVEVVNFYNKLDKLKNSFFDVEKYEKKLVELNKQLEDNIKSDIEAVKASKGDEELFNNLLKYYKKQTHDELRYIAGESLASYEFTDSIESTEVKDDYIWFECRYEIGGSMRFRQRTFTVKLKDFLKRKNRILSTFEASTENYKQLRKEIKDTEHSIRFCTGDNKKTTEEIEKMELIKTKYFEDTEVLWTLFLTYLRLMVKFQVPMYDREKAFKKAGALYELFMSVRQFKPVTLRG